MTDKLLLVQGIAVTDQAGNVIRYEVPKRKGFGERFLEKAAWLVAHGSWWIFIAWLFYNIGKWA